MIVRLKVQHPDIQDNPTTTLTTQYSTGTTLTVQNGLDFLPNDYILIESYGNQVCEIGQVASTTSSTIILKTALNFSHEQGASITRIDYNVFQVYRSTTGQTGIFTQLGSNTPFAVDQNQYTIFVDSAGDSSFYYYVLYYNTTSSLSTVQGSTLSAVGYPLYSLGSIIKRVLKIYVDRTAEFITEESITEWTNELVSNINRQVTGGETGWFMNNATITPTSSEYIDLSTYNIESILMIEYSSDGITYLPNNVIYPTDARYNTNNTNNVFSYKLIDSKLFINNNFPQTYTIRIWYFTQQPYLVNYSDTLPSIYRSYSDVWVDYCLMKANEQSRRFTESAMYYYSKLYKPQGSKPSVIDGMISDIHNIISQGGKQESNIWNPFN